MPLLMPLLKFRSQCSFRQYLPSKPGIYGIKCWILGDAENYYCYNAFPYLGKEGDKIVRNLGATVVKKTCWTNTTPVKILPVIDILLALNFLNTFLRLNWNLLGQSCLTEHLPIGLTTKGNCETNSTLFAFKDSVTMYSWVPKNGKLVLLL